MQLTGKLSEFSLPEIFQFVEQFHQSGLLLLQSASNAASQPGKAHYLWFQEGRIIAVASGLDNNHLLSMLKQRGWLKSELLDLEHECSKVKQPLGLYLKAQGILTDEQLQVLFHAQVIQPVCALFKLQEGEFGFDNGATLPQAEMTGLSLSAAEASLLGLRVLRDWTALAQKLPNLACGLKKVFVKPHLQLDAQESQVWDIADGKTSLEASAKQLQLPVETVQQIAFRMKIAGLVATVSLVTAATPKEPIEEKILEPTEALDPATNVNQSLMKNLVNLLNTKIV
jgi:hypothetical protein